MFRFLPALLFTLVLPIVGAACWLDVPNLRSTEGGYPPGLTGSAGEAPAAEPARADTVPESEADPGRAP